MNANIWRLDLRNRVWYNPDLKSRNYMVPGVIALIVMLTCLLLTSMSVVRGQEVGTMEQLMVTPIRPFELILGKTIPAALIGYFDMALVTVFGVCFGSSAYSWRCSASRNMHGRLSSLGFGLFGLFDLHSFENAATGHDCNIFLFQPVILLSGFATPIETMPAGQVYNLFQPIEILPCYRPGYLLKGVGIDILWPQIAALLVLGIVVTQ